MAIDAPTCRRLAQDIQKRAFIACAFRWWGWLFLLCASLCLVLILLAKLVSSRVDALIDVRVFATVTFTVAVVLGVFAAWRTRWSIAGSALFVDETMRFKDAVSTALSTPPNADPDAARLVLARAESLAATCEPSHVLPIRVDRSWYSFAIVMCTAIACSTWLPNKASIGDADARFEVIDPGQARETIAQASDELRAIDDAIDAQAKSELDEIERELASEREQTAGRALQDAADALDRAAERHDQVAERERDADDRLRQAIQSARESNEPSTTDLAKSVEDADFDQAARQARELAERRPEMSETERKQVADELERLAESMEQTRRDKSTTPKEDSGPNKQSDSQSSPEDKPVKDMSQALKDAAKELRDRTNPAKRQDEGSNAPSSTPQDESTRKDARNTADRAESKQDSRANRDVAQSERSNQEKQPADDQQRTSNPADRQERQQQSGQESSSAERQSGEERTGSQAENSDQRQGAPREGESPDASQRNATSSERSASEQASDEQGERSAPQQDAIKQLAKRFEEAADRSRNSERSSGAAEKLRERADQMRGESNSAQRQQLQDIKERTNPDSGNAQTQGQSAGEGKSKGPKQAATDPDAIHPEKFESVDARPAELGPEIRRRMLSEIEGSGVEGSAEGAPWRRSVEEAAKGAERAIERRGVPRERRDFVRRVFQRYVERAKGEVPAPPRSADDVPAGGGR